MNPRANSANVSTTGEKYENTNFEGLSPGAFQQSLQITQCKNYKPLSKTLDW